MMFKAGDRVKFKSWKELVDNQPIYGFPESMKPLCGTYATVETVSNINSSQQTITLKDFSCTNCKTSWTYSNEMFELAHKETKSNKRRYFKEILEELKSLRKDVDKLMQEKKLPHKITLKEFFGLKDNESLYIHCPTPQDAEALLQEFDRLGERWIDEDSYLENSYYDTYGAYTCYSNNNEFAPYNYVMSKGCKIYEFEDIIFEKPDIKESQEEPEAEDDLKDAADYFFKVGDRVQFKDWDEMLKEYGTDAFENEIATYCSFTDKMKHLCGTYATIKNKNDVYVGLEDFTAEGDTGWQYDIQMLKPVVKEESKWTFTEDEKVILKSLDSKYEYIARDEDGKVFIYDAKPRKRLASWISDRYDDLSIFTNLFESVKWEDSEPCEFRKFI